MDVRSLEVFIEAAELGSFTKAAEKLGYTQPTVSFQIKLLEKEMGVRLFDRIGHTVSLTEEGRDALTYAQHISQLTQEMLLGSGSRQEPMGVLRLGTSDSLCAPLIGEHFADFYRLCPKVSLQVATGDTGELLSYLDHNIVDMIYTIDDRVYNTNYVIADEEEVKAHFVASPRNPLTGMAEVKLEDLVAQPCLLTEKGMSYRRLMDEKLARVSLEIQPVLESGRADLLCHLAEENVGVAFLPDYVTQSSVEAGRLVRLNVPQCQVVVWKQVLYRREKWVSLQMQAMLDQMKSFRLNPVKER